MTATYGTPLELARFLGIERVIPDRRTVGSDRTREDVGLGMSGTARYFLDYAGVIDGSYTLYYGVSEGSGTAFIDVTHYSLNKDNGEITFTPTGTAFFINNNHVWGNYSYVNDDVGLTNTQMQDALDRSQEEIDNQTGSHWADGTSATPDYTKVTDEKHDGKGRFDRDYFSRHFPLPDFKTNLAMAVGTANTTIYVDSTNGFPSSGFFNVDGDKITYTSKTGTAFAGCSGVNSSHLNGGTAYPYVCETSTTDSGTEPNWTVMDVDADVDADLNSGRFHLFKTDYDLTYYALQYPPNLIPNRFRINYLHGYNSIPADVKRLCLMMASKELMHSVVRKAHTAGQNDFNPSLVDIDEEWIKDTIARYTSIQSSNA